MKLMALLSTLVFAANSTLAAADASVVQTTSSALSSDQSDVTAQGQVQAPASNANSTSASSSSAVGEYQTQLVAYAQCVVVAAQYYAVHTNDSASDIAEGAHGMCLRKFESTENTLHLGLLKQLRDTKLADDETRKLMDKSRADYRAIAMSKVLLMRANLNEAAK